MTDKMHTVKHDTAITYQLADADEARPSTWGEFVLAMDVDRLDLLKELHESLEARGVATVALSVSTTGESEPTEVECTLRVTAPSFFERCEDLRARAGRDAIATEVDALVAEYRGSPAVRLCYGKLASPLTAFVFDDSDLRDELLARVSATCASYGDDRGVALCRLLLAMPATAREALAFVCDCCKEGV